MQTCSLDLRQLGNATNKRPRRDQNKDEVMIRSGASAHKSCVLCGQMRIRSNSSQSDFQRSYSQSLPHGRHNLFFRNGRVHSHEPVLPANLKKTTAGSEHSLKLDGAASSTHGLLNGVAGTEPRETTSCGDKAELEWDRREQPHTPPTRCLSSICAGRTCQDVLLDNECNRLHDSATRNQRCRRPHTAPEQNLHLTHALGHDSLDTRDVRSSWSRCSLFDPCEGAAAV